jgi:hypothetical protein
VIYPDELYKFEKCLGNHCYYTTNKQKVLISNANFAKLKTELRKITDEVYDSILFYTLRTTDLFYR